MGTRLGRYEILAPLGSGGMGEVYRARDPRLQRDVAIKVLPEAVALDAAALARFGREALAAATTTHPNILSLFDVGTEQGITYAVMELLEGSTLREKIAAGPLSLEETLGIARQIADGLVAMHDRGIVHRDLKPENLFVTSDGHVKILDFGLARILPRPGEVDDAAPTVTGVTVPGTIMGTIGYMAPEQLQGRPVDQRADLFCLGAILYELLAGRRAFSGTSWAEVSAAILRENPLPLTGVRVPPAFEAILRRCLEKDPDARFPSAREILDGLKSVDTAPPPSTPDRSRSRLRPWLFAATSLALVLAYLVLSGRPPPADHTTSVPARTASIAMLEFENLTGDPAFDWIGRGLPELLGTAMARSRDLDVYDPQRLSQLLGSPDRTTDAGAPAFERLKGRGIGRAIVGSMLRSGGDIRLQCRVVDVETSKVLHAASITGPASDDLFRLAGELIPRLQTWLEIDLVAAGSESQWLRDITTSSSDAYRLYLRAREALIASRWREAASYAEQAVAIDTQFVAAYVDLVGSCWNLGDEARMQKNLDILRRLRDSASPRDVIQIDLIDAVVTEDPERLIRSASSAHELYPEDRFFTYLLGRGYYTAGRYPECIQVLEPLIRGRYAWAWTYVLAAKSHQKLGNITDARRCFETGMDVTRRNPEVAMVYAGFLREEGDTARARTILLEAGRSPGLAESPEAETQIRLELARLYEAEGKPDSARTEYERILAILSPEPSDSTNLVSDERRKAALDGLNRVGVDR